MSRSSRSSESGGVLLYVVLVAVVIAGLAASISVSTMLGVRGGGAAAGRAGAQRAVEDGLALYRVALEQRVANESTNWLPRENALKKLLKDGDSPVGRRGELVRIDDPNELGGLPEPLKLVLTDSPAYIVRMDIGGGQYRFWQFLRVIGPGVPGGADGEVVVWMRGWQGARDGSTARAPLHARAAFTPGGFQQFQLLTDGPILFDDGARINGPVHSNGVGAGNGLPAISPARADPDISCAGGAARLSAAPDQGIVGMPNSCKIAESSRRWNLAVVRDSLDGIRSSVPECATQYAGVHIACPLSFGFVQVKLQGDSVDIGGQVRPIGDGLVILVHGDVMVSGHANGRVTIASDPAKAPDGVTADRARGGQIRVVGDVTSNGGSIGLFTEGDVVVETDGCPVTRLEAVVIASRGGLTIDRGYRTDIAQLDAPSCDEFRFVGSIAAAEAPVLAWSWPAGVTAGFKKRSYTWNPRLLRAPPPWAPVIEGWQVSNWQEAPGGCVKAGPAAGGVWDTTLCP